METTSRMNSKGGVIIPAWLRKKLGLKAGMRVSFSQKGNDIIIHPQTRQYFRSMAGFFGTDSKAVDILLEERKKDTIKENAKIKRYLRSR